MSENKKTITLILNGKIGMYAPKVGDTIGCQYTWNDHKSDRISMLDKEEWFVERIKLLDVDIYELLNELDVPIIVQKKWKKLKNQQIYPLKQIIKKFSIEYFTCTQAYLLALALYEGYKRIYLIGWDNHVPNELDIEWNNIVWDETVCLNFWIGFAKGMGVEVIGGNVVKPVTLYNEKLYAYNVSKIHKRKRKEILDRLKQLNKEYAKDKG